MCVSNSVSSNHFFPRPNPDHGGVWRKQLLLCFVLFCFAFYTIKVEWIIKPDLSCAICQPKYNLAFIKTHKTGSSSLFHVFIRFADKYQRPLIYQKELLSVTKFDRSSLLGLKPGYKYNVFASHIIFDYQEMRAVMPDDTKYITILRDPVAQFQSLYNYVFLELYNGMNISAFAHLNISDPEESKVIKKRIIGSFGVNQMAFDLGMDPSLFDDEDAILEKVQELDRQLDLVMIAKLFGESVILMKEKLCWKDWNDVISFKVNVIKSDYKARLSSEQKENLRRINRVDQMIYDHFYQKLLGQIDAFGKEKMEEEVEKLREATKEMYDLCVDDDHNNNNSVNENQNLDDLFSFKLKKAAESDQLCRDLTTDFHHLMIKIVGKQKAFYSEENAISLDLIKAKLQYSFYSIFRDFNSFLLRNNLAKVTRFLYALFLWS